MADFSYTAFDASGQRKTGVIQANSRQDAISKLNASGLLPIEAQEARGGAGVQSNGKIARGAPKSADLTVFMRELGLLLGAGLKLGEALNTIRGDDASPRVQALAGRLSQAISSGISFSDAMTAEGALFPPIHIGMVTAAERAGKLPETLGRIADMRESEQELRSKIVTALTYPTFLILTAISAMLFVLLAVVPRFKSALAVHGDRLPATAAFVFGAADFLSAYGQWIMVALIMLLVLGLVLSRQAAVRAWWARTLVKLPLIGQLVRYALTVRFCRTVGTLSSSGLSLPETLNLTRNVIGNEEARNAIDRASAALRDGQDFTQGLAKTTVFPPLVPSLLKMGADTSALPDVAGRLATMYENKLDTSLERLMSILQPAIIVLVGAMIAFIVFSIMSAIVGIYDLSGV